jgi:hypothetical protein
LIYILWKKDERFNPNYENNKSGEKELEPSFASVPKEPTKANNKSLENVATGKQKVTLVATRVTQDKHPSKHRRMPSFA